MNKLIINILILITLILCFVESAKNDKGLIDLIINPKKKRNYDYGDECGGSTRNTCYSIGDAVAYFEKLKSKTNDTLSLQVNLAEGEYGVGENSIYTTNLNINIITITKNTKKVIFEGTNNATNTYLFGLMQGSTFAMEDIIFQNFNQSIMNAQMNSDIYIKNCNFTYNNITNGIPLINVFLNSKLTMTNVSFVNSNSSSNHTVNTVNGGYLDDPYKTYIQTKYTNVYLKNVTVDSVFGLDTFISSGYGNSQLSIVESSFNNVSTNYGVVHTLHSQVYLSNSNFTNNTVAIPKWDSQASVLSLFISDLSMVGCQIINNTFPEEALYGGSTVNILDSNSVMINDTLFINNTGVIGAAISSYSSGNIKLNNCTFINNTLSSSQNITNRKGAVFYVSQSNIRVSNSYISNTNISYEHISNGTFYAYLSTVEFISNSFGNRSISSHCVESTYHFRDSSLLIPYYVCDNCDGIRVDDDDSSVGMCIPASEVPDDASSIFISKSSFILLLITISIIQLFI